MDELGVSGQVQQFHGLRKQQQRWRRKQDRVGQRDNGADRAGIALLLPVGILIGRGLLLGRLSERVGCGEAAGIGKV